MPPRYVKTIEEEIFYEYAKLISRAATAYPKGCSAFAGKHCGDIEKGIL